MPTWTKDELDRVGGTSDLHISPMGTDGALHPPVPIWVVRVGDELFVRSYRGAGGTWYRRAARSGRARIEADGVRKDVRLSEVGAALRPSIDAAYFGKYGEGPYVAAMVTVQAAATTARLDPTE